MNHRGSFKTSVGRDIQLMEGCCIAGDLTSAIVHQAICEEEKGQPPSGLIDAESVLLTPLFILFPRASVYRNCVSEGYPCSVESRNAMRWCLLIKDGTAAGLTADWGGANLTK